MPLLDRPRVFQPQDGAKLRPALEESLSVLALGSEAAFRGCTSYTEAGGITRAPSPGGIAWQGDATDNAAYATPLRDGSITTTGSLYATMVVVFRKRASGASTGHIAGFGSSGGGTGNTLHRLVGGSDSNQIQFQLQSSSGGLPYNTASSSAGINDQNWHVAVIPYQVTPTLADDSLTYFIDGASRGTVARSAGVANTTFNRASVGAAIRGGSVINPGNWDVALYLHLLARMPNDWCQQASTLGTVWDALFEPRRIWVPVSASGPSLDLSASAIALAGSMGVSGDLQIGTSFNLAASPVALAGSMSVAGDLQIEEAPTLDLSASTIALTGTLAATGDLQIGTSFDLAASTVALSGSLGVGGDIETSTAPTLDLSASPIALAGTLGLAGDIQIGTSFDLSSSTIALAGSLGVSGDIQSSDTPLPGPSYEGTGNGGGMPMSFAKWRQSLDEQFEDGELRRIQEEDEMVLDCITALVAAGVL